MIFNYKFALFAFGLILLSRPNGAVGKRITLEQLYSKMRNQSFDFFRHHFGLMWTVSGYNDKLYNVDTDVSPSCAIISGATQVMLEQLRITEETYQAVIHSIVLSREDVMNAQPIVEHPLEFLCRRVQRAYAEKPLLSSSLNLAKIVARSAATGGRPAYADDLIPSLAAMGKLLDSWATIPELARAMANSGFRNQVNASKAYTPRHHILVKSVFQIVHKDDEYANMMQDMYERMLTKLLPQITNNATSANTPALTLSDGKTFWFFPRMMKMFFHQIEKDEILRKELADTAAIVGKGYDNSVLDFSKI